MNEEYYELRIYKIFDYEKQMLAEAYLETALVPALKKMGIERVGVFTNHDDENDHSMFVLIPYTSLDQFSQMTNKLDADDEYQNRAAIYFDRPLKDPVFERIESRFLKAFAGMPTMEIPELTKTKAERIFELRLYQSHTEDHARRKVKMFNDGEIQIMRDVKLGPVFFGQTLIGHDSPNLVYMLSSTDKQAHKQHFKDFLAHPEWKRIKDLKEYKGTVSKIQNWFLTPTRYSSI
ncbi:MAG: NIPSNAP family protein [Planctomycetota bacterium]